MFQGYISPFPAERDNTAFANGVGPHVHFLMSNSVLCILTLLNIASKALLFQQPTYVGLIRTLSTNLN